MSGCISFWCSALQCGWSCVQQRGDHLWRDRGRGPTVKARKTKKRVKNNKRVPTTTYRPKFRLLYFCHIEKSQLSTFHHILSFSEGGFILGLSPPFFVRVWHPGFVELVPAPAFFSHRITSSEIHPLLYGVCSQWYRVYKLKN